MRKALTRLEADLRARLVPHVDADPVVRLLCQRFGREATVSQTIVDDLVARRGPRRTYQTVVQLALLPADDPNAREVFSDGLAWLGRRDFRSAADPLPLDPLGQFALAVGANTFRLDASWLVDLIRRQPVRPADEWPMVLSQASLCLLGQPIDATRALPFDVVAALRGSSLWSGSQPERAAVYDRIREAGPQPPERLVMRLAAAGWLRARLDEYLDETELAEVVNVIARERLGSDEYMSLFLSQVDPLLVVAITPRAGFTHGHLWHVLTGLNQCDDAHQLRRFLASLAQALETRLSIRTTRIQALHDEVQQIAHWQDEAS